MKKLILIIVLIFQSLSLKAADFNLEAKTAILQDYLSGEILYEKDADMSIYPASMTKIMTSIVAFDLIKKGELNMDDKFMVSENAWRLANAGYSSMFIMVGDEVSVENLLKGIIIASGNDACVALAEGIAGTEEEFAIMMTAKAQEIGMYNTNFSNSSGINDPNNYSTARDILIMSDHLIRNYPDFYSYFSEKEFSWDRTGGDPITQGNRNTLLYKDIGVDGIKTGYLAYEKYSLASSIKRNDRRLIGVASGFETKTLRSKESAKLLTYGITNFDTIRIAENEKAISTVEVWHGKKNNLSVYLKQDIFKTIPKAKKKYLKAKVIYDGPIVAPIKKDQEVALLKVYYKDELLDEYKLLAAESIKRLNVFSRLFRSINFLIWGDV